MPKKTIPDACDEYAPCWYENLLSFVFRSKKPQKPGEGWKKRIVIFMVLYVFAIVAFRIFLSVFDCYVCNGQAYMNAALVLATAIFWPIIIIYDSELFYRACKKMQNLLTPSARSLDWYRKSANAAFCLFPKGEPVAVGAIVINAVCILSVTAIYVLKTYVPELIPEILDDPKLLVVCVIICALTIGLQSNNRNLLCSMLTVCCGVAYFTFISEYAEFKLIPLFVKGFIPGTVLIIGLMYVVFFIAGSTIMPMLSLFKTFFMSDFEDYLDYPIDDIANSLDVIQSIKDYFMHLTVINLVAYFQLLGTVFFLGLLSTESVITKILFLLGSFFPVIMYLAAILFFKKLCRKIYIRQVSNLDRRIYLEMNTTTFDPDRVQALVAVKEMYANEFEVHAEMSKEILVAMLTPVITALAAVLVPGASIIGG